MTPDRTTRGRRSLRLRDNDYAQNGAYYVTLCIQRRAHLLGEIADGAIRLSDAGRMVHLAWETLPSHLPGVEMDSFIVMPDHLHGIIVLTGSGECRPCIEPGPDNMIAGQEQICRHPLSLGDVVARFKTWTMRQYATGVREYDWPLYMGRLWQRNYYDHIVRDEADLARIREYIATNVACWAENNQDWGDL